MQSLFMIMRIIIIIDILNVNSLGGQADPVGIDSAWATLEEAKKKGSQGEGGVSCPPNGERLISGDLSDRREGGKQGVRGST